ncbi:MAG TPA: PTS system mannose/fructose/sorbose family transporter subunit IID [Candidatus Krumholzibacteria bacterium]|nr:PTS system mannose/fructose/sorbose family transporter subunit IID [Candidatus Krumholzibacteria bacterium]
MSSSYRSAWRLWFLQSSWNREGMQSLGFLVCLLPEARRRGLQGADLARWARDRLGYFNTNPYLAGMIVGATLHLDRSGREEESLRLQKGLASSLGALGDPFFWEGARPAVAYLGLSAAFLLGPIGILAAWALFAIASGAIRELCLRLGVERGPGVVDFLTRSWVHRSMSWARAAAGLSCGLALALGFFTRWNAQFSPFALICALGALICGFLAAWRRWPLDRVLILATILLWGILRSTSSM